jgi:hypothetical protein
MQHKDKTINNTCQKTKLIFNLNTSKDARKRHNMNYETPPKFKTSIAIHAKTMQITKIEAFQLHKKSLYLFGLQKYVVIEWYT